MPEARAARVEGPDLNVRALVLVGLALAAVIGLVCIAVALLLGRWNIPLTQSTGAPAPEVAGPRQPTAPMLVRARFEAEKKALLESYGWVDRDAGVARIPVKEAMRMLAAPSAEGPGNE